MCLNTPRWDIEAKLVTIVVLYITQPQHKLVQCKHSSCFTCTHPAQHCSVADTWGVGVVGGSIVGRQAGQEQAPAQDNRGQINDCYLGKTAATDTKHVVGLRM